MQLDQIYDSGEDLTDEAIDEFFRSIGVENVPEHYRIFLSKHNGG